MTLSERDYTLIIDRSGSMAQNAREVGLERVLEDAREVGAAARLVLLEDLRDTLRADKSKGSAKPETILVITDGEPDDRRAVIRTIIDASRRIDRDEELALSIVQVGKDPDARRFLKLLDDELVSAGAPFDICDTVTLDEAESIGLTEVLLAAIHD